MNNLNITSQCCCGSAVAVLLLYAVHLSGKSEDGFGRRMGSCTPGNTQPMTLVMGQRFVIMMGGLNEKNYTSSDDSVLSGLFILTTTYLSEDYKQFC